MSYDPSVQLTTDSGRTELANYDQSENPETTKRLVRVDGLVGLIFLVAIAFFTYWFADSVRTKFKEDQVTQGEHDKERTEAERKHRELYERELYERDWMGNQQAAR